MTTRGPSPDATGEVAHRLRFAVTKWRLLWPLLLPMAAIGAHFWSLRHWPHDAQLVHAAFALGLQLSGGFLILYSIDKNLWAVRGSGLIMKAKEYAARVLRDQLPAYLEGVSAEARADISTGKVRTFRRPSSVEEHIAHLQQQVEWLKEDLAEAKRQLEQRIDNSNKELRQHIGRIESRLIQLRQQFDSVTVEGAWMQILGAVFIVHGAFAAFLGGIA